MSGVMMVIRSVPSDMTSSLVRALMISSCVPLMATCRPIVTGFVVLLYETKEPFSTGDCVILYSPVISMFMKFVKSIASERSSDRQIDQPDSSGAKKPSYEAMLV